jgi:ubiquinone/menaquinone biosynthesis C-methylase UbiE
MSYVERLVVSEEEKQTLLYDEHIIRYELVKPFVSNKIVLDIASGSGYGADILAQAGAKKVIGIDIDEQAVADAQKRYGSNQIEFKVGKTIEGVEKLEIADNSIEVIACFETIEHIKDYKGFLQELARVLTAEGVTFISTPNRDVFGQKNPFHIKEFTKKEFIEELQKHFSFVSIFEQKNGLASVISGSGQQKILVQDKNSEALYFIAICSQREIIEKVDSVASINISALKRWENNKGWRLLNWLYAIGQKYKILK